MAIGEITHLLCFFMLPLFFQYVLFLFLIAGTVFIPNDPLFEPIYMNIARVGAVLFVFLQQIILVDLGEMMLNHDLSSIFLVLIL